MSIGRSEAGLLFLVILITAGAIYADHVDRTTEIPDENRIFEIIEYDIGTIDRFSWIQSHYEVAVANPENFKRSAANGTVNLRLLGEDLEVQVHESSVFTNPEMYPDIKTYHGKIAGIPESSASFTAANDVVLGHIDAGTESYYIEQTNKRYDGKVVHVIYSSDAIGESHLKRKILSLARIMVDLRPKFQKGNLEFTVIPEKTTVPEKENFDIYLTLTNVGEKTINVWEMAEQISYDICFYDSNDTKASYVCGVLMREQMTNENLVELSPGQSLNTTFNSKCWDLKKGEYALNAIYHTSTGEAITEPYWLGEVQSNNVTIVVE
ncbi:hypothetical protein [Methanococcoides sp. AM1]|uniref:hypothetical protein n=1 Tax=Methanococcoides sp. AM1 TaxID=1201011 RepID=UPI001438323D|nr:hypothetical protein [Methanococcoides sp. AM1]